MNLTSLTHQHVVLIPLPSARLGVVPRPASPTLPECGDSTNDLNLAPELRAIAEKIKSQPSLPRVEGLGLDELEITVRWVPHPDNPHGKREEFGYRITKVRISTSPGPRG